MIPFHHIQGYLEDQNFQYNNIQITVTFSQYHCLLYKGKVPNIGWVPNIGYVDNFLGKCNNLADLYVIASSVVGHYAIYFLALL